MTALDPVRLRRVCAAFPTGVVFLAALSGDRPVGLVASSFTSVSLDPPLVSTCVAHTSTTWPTLRAATRLGVSVLADTHEPVLRQLADRGADRFAALKWHASADGAVLLEDAAAWFDVSIAEHMPAGDHDIVLLAVHDVDADHDVRPLIFHASRITGLAV